MQCTFYWHIETNRYLNQLEPLIHPIQDIDRGHRDEQFADIMLLQGSNKRFDTPNFIGHKHNVSSNPNTLIESKESNSGQRRRLNKWCDRSNVDNAYQTEEVDSFRNRKNNAKIILIYNINISYLLVPILLFQDQWLT